MQSSRAILDAFADADRAFAKLRAVITSGDQEEEPVPIKVLAHRYDIGERQMRRLARAGFGIKRGNRWYGYDSRMAMKRGHPCDLSK